MIKVASVLNRISTFLFLVILLLVYAYLPIEVDLNVEEIGSVHKQSFFYYSLAAYLILNILLRVIFHFGLKSISTNLKAWMTGLIFIVNFYLTFIIGFVGVLNNDTHINPSSYGYLNFLGPILIILWVIGLIFLVVKKS